MAVWNKVVVAFTPPGTRAATRADDLSTYDAAGSGNDIVETTPIPDQTSLESKREMTYNADGQILTRKDWYKDGSTWKQGKDEGSVQLQNIAPRLIDQAAWSALTKAQCESSYDARDTQRLTYRRPPGFE